MNKKLNTTLSLFAFCIAITHSLSALSEDVILSKDEIAKTAENDIPEENEKRTSRAKQVRDAKQLIQTIARLRHDTCSFEVWSLKGNKDVLESFDEPGASLSLATRRCVNSFSAVKLDNIQNIAKEFNSCNIAAQADRLNESYNRLLCLHHLRGGEKLESCLKATQALSEEKISAAVFGFGNDGPTVLERKEHPMSYRDAGLRLCAQFYRNSVSTEKCHEITNQIRHPETQKLNRSLCQTGANQRTLPDLPGLSLQ